LLNDNCAMQKRGRNDAAAVAYCNRAAIVAEIELETRSISPRCGEPVQ
jgi:hypothetical protein